MIELIDTLPDTNVQPAEYKRLLGFPRERVLEERPRELAEWARSWFARNGRPWVYARQAQTLAVVNDSILLDGETFTSKRLQKTLTDAQADSAILVAVSAGPEIEAEAKRAWLEEKPDEYFFLEIFGSAIVEHLITTIGARLCAWAENHSLAVLPHYSPGYPEWDISEQARLLTLLRRTQKQPLPGEVDVLESGMLKPKKSLLAVFGLTHEIERVKKLTDLVPCENCSYSPCQFRRAPYDRPSQNDNGEIAAPPVPAPSLDRAATYSVNPKALKRWADERLKLMPNDDGTTDATFWYEGTTCSSMGRSFVFHYYVKLGPRELGYPIREMRCTPAAGDEGHKFMCRYMNNAEHLMVAIEQDRPLLGKPLNDVLTWPRPTTGPGCYCEPPSRKHKWGLALETIHQALVQRDGNEETAKARRREEEREGESN